MVMTARITNADAERMMREMSPAAREFADALARVLDDMRKFSNPFGEYSDVTEANRDNYRAYIEVGFPMDERLRAIDLTDALHMMLRRRYEIRDRWGE